MNIVTFLDNTVTTCVKRPVNFLFNNPITSLVKGPVNLLINNPVASIVKKPFSSLIEDPVSTIVNNPVTNLFTKRTKIPEDLSSVTTIKPGEVDPSEIDMAKSDVDAIWGCVEDLYRT